MHKLFSENLLNQQTVPQIIIGLQNNFNNDFTKITRLKTPKILKDHITKINGGWEENPMYVKLFTTYSQRIPGYKTLMLCLNITKIIFILTRRSTTHTILENGFGKPPIKLSIGLIGLQENLTIGIDNNVQCTYDTTTSG